MERQEVKEDERFEFRLRRTARILLYIRMSFPFFTSKLPGFVRCLEGERTKLFIIWFGISNGIILLIFRSFDPEVSLRAALRPALRSRTSYRDSVSREDSVSKETHSVRGRTEDAVP